MMLRNRALLFTFTALLIVAFSVTPSDARMSAESFDHLAMKAKNGGSVKVIVEFTVPSGSNRKNEQKKIKESVNGSNVKEFKTVHSGQ